MDVLLNMLQEELSRSKRLERKYVRDLASLVKGSFFVRAVRGRKYGYLSFRRDGKVVQKYLGLLDDDAIQEYRQVIRRRSELRKRLIRVRQHLRVLKRALRGKELSARR